MKRERHRGLIDASRMLAFNTAHARWMSLRAWSQTTVSSTLVVYGYYEKPFAYAWNLTNIDRAMPTKPLYAFPLTPTVYDGPTILSAATVNGLAATDMMGVFAGTLIGAPVQTGPNAGTRYAQYERAIQPGNTLTVSGAYYMRYAMHTGLQWAMECVAAIQTGNTFLFLDTNAGTTSYAGIYYNGASGFLEYRDNLGNITPMQSISAGWQHFLIHWNGTQLTMYANGVAGAPVARAAVTTIADYTTGNQIWNYTASNYIAAPAFYYNLPAGADIAGMAKRHYEDWFFNYKLISGIATSGVTSGFISWNQTFSRDSNPGIPDAIGISPDVGAWWYDLQIEQEA